MLQNTFCHIPGIGSKTERDLWSAGCRSWRAITDGKRLPLSPGKAELLRRGVRESAAHLAGGNCDYFYEHLASNQHWRMFPDFEHSVAYVDIETTGLGGPRDYITTIVLYDGRSIRHYVHGDNLADFAGDIARYRLLVTYNGKTFDVPFIRGDLGAPMDQAHIDLRYVLASLGYRGGLKGCERQLGLGRNELAGVDGYFAVLLWRDFRRRGNERALETLLAYNVLDVVNLATLMPLAYNMKIRHTPFADSHKLPVPAAPPLPFTPDRDTIERIKREHGW